MDMSSYDQLLRQVEGLKNENAHLRRELQDNSKHLTKLELEACNMKNVLNQLSTSMTDNLDMNSNNGPVTDVIRSVHIRPNSMDLTGSPGSLKSLHSTCTSPEGTPKKRLSTGRELYNKIQEMDRERSDIVATIEQEDQERKMIYNQLDRISKEIETLERADNLKYNFKNDMKRRQLEHDVKQLQDHLHNKLGTEDQMARRHRLRMQRIAQIEKEMLLLQKQQSLLSPDVEQNKRDSGSFDLNEQELNGKTVVDAATNTISNGKMFVFTSLDDEQPPDVSSSSTPGGSCNSDKGSMSVGTQTIGCQEVSPIVHSPIPERDKNLSVLYHGEWAIPGGMFGSGPGSTGSGSNLRLPDTDSVMSFSSQWSGVSNVSGHSGAMAMKKPHQQFGTKVEMVYSLLSMLGTHDKDDMSKTLLAMSSSSESCIAMRQSGCLPLLIQLLHGNDKESPLGGTRGNKDARARAAAALHNIVHSHPDDKKGRREARVLRLLEQIRAHCNTMRDGDSSSSDDEGCKGAKPGHIDHHPGPAVAAIMKLSFDEEHRHAMCQLGGLHAIAELIYLDHECHGNTSDQYSLTLRRYAGMALTNLTFGDGTNKALLCSMKSCMKSLVAQLHSPNEDLIQVTASVLRNLSWRADLASKKILREVGAVTTLMKAAMVVQKESTLKSILSALWNLSAHCSENKADICAIDGTLEFLVSTLSYKSPSKTLAIIENGGGILRNVSSHIAVREDYRAVLRHLGCLQILLKHLKSPSLTIVSNACGTLWNLSARNAEDQQALWEMGAVGMLRNLVHSKHKMISMGSSAALKNLLSSRPLGAVFPQELSQKSGMPGLHVRKQKALEAELDQNLTETCENIDSSSPTGKSESDKRAHVGTFPRSGQEYHPRSLLQGSAVLIPSQASLSHRPIRRSESCNSVGSTQSDVSHDRMNRGRNVIARSNRLLVERYQRGHSASPDQRNLVRSQIMPPSCNDSEFGVKISALTASFQESTQPTNSTPSLDRRSLPCSPRTNKAGLGKAMYSKYANMARQYDSMSAEQDYENDQPVNYGLQFDESNSVVIDRDDRPPVQIDNYMRDNSHTDSVGHTVWHGQSNKSPYNSINHSFSSPAVGMAYEACHVQPTSGYAETDLDNPDQPTDFSKRYAEFSDTSEYHAQFFKNKVDRSVKFSLQDKDSPLPESQFYSQPCMDDDSVMQFHTEGTPLNFSTSTSLTDLTKEKDIEIMKANVKHETVSGVSSPDSRRADRGSPVRSDHSASPVSPRNETNYIKTEDDAKSQNAEDEHIKSYCLEGTPVCFSHVSSLSSLHSTEADNKVLDNTVVERENIMMVENVDDEEDTANPETRAVAVGDELTRGEDDTAEKVEDSQPAAKMVTFDTAGLPLETPMMFSRSSSLGSLDSFEQKSIHDDRSSVYSEFPSRLTSGMISPSELPDSPSESMPSSPKHKKPPSFPLDTKETASKNVANSKDTSKEYQKLPENVFNDRKTAFATEGTPAQFSTVTSLSSLSFEEQCKTENEEVQEEPLLEASADSRRLSHEGEQEPPNNSKSGSDNASELSEISETENDQDILAECINSAMPWDKSKAKKNLKNIVGGEMTDSNVLARETTAGAKQGFHASEVPNFDGSSKKTFNHVQKRVNFSTFDNTDDMLKTFNVEGTPLNFSTAASSLSDLSVPSCDRMDGDGEFQESRSRHKSDENNQLISEDQSETSSMCDEGDYILEDLIQEAMPKGKSKKHPSGAGIVKKSPDTATLAAPYNAAISAVSVELPTDTVTSFAIEGTPALLSGATSLSDLTLDSNDVYKSNANSDLSKHENKLHNENTSSSHLTQIVSVKQTFPSQPNPDSVRNFAVEDTPVVFSRSHSPLSCITINDESNFETCFPHVQADNSLQSRTSPDRLGAVEVGKMVNIDDRAVSFSRNSSLSSLSIESIGAEPSASEQALLDECINAALPKSKSERCQAFQDRKKLKGKWKIEKKLSEEKEDEVVTCVGYEKVERDLNETEKKTVDISDGEESGKQNEETDGSESTKETASVNSDLSKFSDADLSKIDSDADIGPFEEIGIIPDMAISAIMDEPQPMLASGVYSEDMSCNFEQKCSLQEANDSNVTPTKCVPKLKNGQEMDCVAEGELSVDSGAAGKSDMVRSHNDEINQVIVESGRIASQLGSSLSNENNDADETFQATGDLDITLEANIVLTHLHESKQECTSSMTDDIGCLEDETLSLVSTDCLSECSEVSFPDSEPCSESSFGRPPKLRPRITKPTVVVESKVPTEEQVKSIRGRRKPLYSVKRPVGKDPPPPGASIRGGSQIKHVTKPRPAKQEPQHATKTETGHVQFRQKQVDGRTVKRISTGDLKRRSNGEKPKPIIKQGTFTKDKPTINAPQISPTGPPRNSECSDVTMGKSQVRQRPSCGNLAGEKPYPSASWSKTLTDLNFQVDSPKDNDASGTNKQSSRTPPRTPPRTHLPKNGAGSVNSGAKSTMRTSTSSQSLKRADSGSFRSAMGNQSLKKAGSVPTKLGKTGSNLSLNKDSQSTSNPRRDPSSSPPSTARSVHSSRTASPSRDASNSPPSSIRGKPVISSRTGKPVVSRISSLWKKSGASKQKQVAIKNSGAKAPSDGISRSTTYEKIPCESKILPKHVDSNNMAADKCVDDAQHLKNKSFSDIAGAALISHDCAAGDVPIHLKSGSEHQLKQDGSFSASQLPQPHSKHQPPGASRLPTSESLKSRQKSQPNLRTGNSSAVKPPNTKCASVDTLADKAVTVEVAQEGKETKVKSAIVPPFNYYPYPKSQVQNTQLPQPDKPRRPNSYVSSMENNGCDNNADSSDNSARGYLVTTV